MAVGIHGGGKWRRKQAKACTVGWFPCLYFVDRRWGWEGWPGNPRLYSLVGDNPRLFSAQAFFSIFASESKGKLSLTGNWPLEVGN